MSDNKYNRSVTLICPTCGGTDFEYDDADDNAPVRCVGCNRVVSRQTLIDENQERIASTVDEIKDEVVADITKQFRDAFRGSKWKLR